MLLTFTPYKNMSRRHIVICVVAIVMIIPFPTIIAPIWKVRVINIEGSVCPNKEVWQGWAHYSVQLFGIGGDTETRLTDNEGYVEFPKRTIWSPLSWRILAGTIAHVLTIAHGSEGPHASLHTDRLKDVAWISYEPEEPIPDIMVVRSCDK